MLILRGISGHFDGRHWASGALHEEPALEYARRRGYVGKVLNVSGETGPDSAQTVRAPEKSGTAATSSRMYGIFRRRIQRPPCLATADTSRTQTDQAGGGVGSAEQFAVTLQGDTLHEWIDGNWSTALIPPPDTWPDRKSCWPNSDRRPVPCAPHRSARSPHHAGEAAGFAHRLRDVALEIADRRVPDITGTHIREGAAVLSASQAA